MREEVEIKQRKVYEIAESIEQNEKELLMLEKDLKSINQKQQSKERYIGLLIKDKQVKTVYLANKQEKLQELESQLLVSGQSPNPEVTSQDFEDLQEDSFSLEHELDQLESKITTGRQVSSELTQELQRMSSQIDVIMHELHSLQVQKIELLQDVQKSEQELDDNLIGNSLSVPTEEQVSYLITCIQCILDWLSLLSFL